LYKHPKKYFINYMCGQISKEEYQGFFTFEFINPRQD